MSATAPHKHYYLFANGPVHRPLGVGEDNAMDISSFRQLHTMSQSRGFGIKYVIRGTEHYKLNGRYYEACAGSYLLTNAFTHSEVTIDSNMEVLGACMEISPSLLAEVLGVLQAPGSPWPKKDFYDYLTTARFFEHKYSAGKTELGLYLQQAAAQLTPKLPDQLYLAQFYYSVAEKLLTGQREVYGYLTSLNIVKASTRKDLMARLMRGKELIDDTYTEGLSIAAIAREAAMSEYYFLRLFSKAFGRPPYRYVIDRRLEKAAAMLQAGHDTVVSIAYKCGFADIHSFSKSFKKKYGVSPSEW